MDLIQDAGLGVLTRSHPTSGEENVKKLQL